MLRRVRRAETRNRLEKNKTTSGSYPLVGSLTKKQISAQKNTFALDPAWGSLATPRQADKNNKKPVSIIKKEQAATLWGELRLPLVLPALVLPALLLLLLLLVLSFDLLHQQRHRAQYQQGQYRADQRRGFAAHARSRTDGSGHP